MKIGLFTIFSIIFVLVSSSGQAQSIQRGGFIYNWENYDDDDEAGLGKRMVNWDSSDLVSITHAPATGVHPRVYFGPSEMPDILDRLEHTESGQAVINQIHAYTTLLHVGNAYNQNADYALDAFGNRYINNAGAWNMAPYYTALKEHDPSVWDGVDIKILHRTAALMSLEAFMCLFYLENDDIDVGVDYQTRSLELADAMEFWATLVLGDPTVNPSSFNKFGGTHMALCYDLNYHQMSIQQRDRVRMALARIVPASPRHGGTTTSYANTSNWSTLNSFEIITNLAIEGETGYQPELTHLWMRSLHNFINYGWYPSGAGYEGLGKNYQFVTTLIACAKRGYSLLSHPHVRSYGEDFLTGIMQPFGQGFTSYDVWGGSGYDEELGMYKFNSADAVGLKWAFPESSKIDFVWRNYIERFYQNSSEGYVYAQIVPDDSYNNYLIPAAVFAMDYNSNDWQSIADEVIEEDYVAEDRGLAVFKSSSDRNALAVQFHARQDMGGHTHGDRLDFTLSGLGRIWIRKSYSGSQFQTSRHHSMVLVNDLGVPVGDPDGDKCRQPATLLDYTLGTDLSQIAADATYAYSWEWHWSPQAISNDHPWLGNNGWQKVTETWNDFQFNPSPEPHFSIPFYDFPHWTQGGKLERMVKRPYNPVDKVVRRIGLIKGSHPMLLVIDDVRKDSVEHNYKWTCQLARDLTFESYAINLADEDYKCDIILKEPSTTGDRKLLIRILQNEGYDGSMNPAEIELMDYIDYFTQSPFTPNPNWDRSRLVVENNSICPNFKVLLFPFFQEDELPITNWNSTKDTLEIVFSNEEKVLAFRKDENDNTKMTLIESSTAFDEVNEQASITKIFPNPTFEFLNIYSDQQFTELKVFNLEGKQILRKSDFAGSTYQLSVRDLMQGNYYLVLYDKERKIVDQLEFTVSR